MIAPIAVPDKIVNCTRVAHFVRIAPWFTSGVLQTASDGVRATQRSLAVLSSAVCAGRDLNLTRLLTPFASLAGSNRRAKNRAARECAALVLCRPGFEPNPDVLAHFVRCARLGGFKSGVLQTASDEVRATRRSLAVLSSAVCAGRDLNPGHELGRLRSYH